MIAGNVKYCQGKKKKQTPKQFKAIDRADVTALDQAVREGFFEQLTTEQRQRDEGRDDKSQLCKYMSEECSNQRE